MFADDAVEAHVAPMHEWKSIKLAQYVTGGYKLGML